MNDGLWFYLRRTWRNRLWSALSKIKQPKYGLGLAFGVGYLIVFMVLPLVLTKDVGPSLAGRSPTTAAWVGAALILFAFLISLRKVARDPGLAMYKAELHFLLTAPLSRRQVVAFWVIRQQPGLLLSSVFVALFGWWLGADLLIAWPIGYLGLNLVVAVTLAARQISGALQARGLASLGGAPYWTLLVGLLVGLALAYRPYAHQGLQEYLLGIMATQPLATVLWPFHQLSLAFFAPDVAGAAPALGALALVIPSLLCLALWRPAPYEEASLKISNRIEAFKAGGWRAFRKARAKERKKNKPRPAGPMPVPFKLGPLGSPALALVWKNLIGTGRIHRPRALLAAIACAASLGTLVAVVSPVGSVFPIVMAGVIGYATFLGVLITMQHLRYDLHLDIPHFLTLRSYPLTASQLLHGEVLGLTLVASGYAVIGLVAMVALVNGVGSAGDWYPLGWERRAPILMAAILLTVGATYVLVTIGNLIALIWPAWSQIGHKPQVGFTQFGSNLLGIIVRMIFFGLALVVPTVVAGGTYALLGVVSGWWFWAAPPAALLGTAVLVGEALIAIRLAKPAYDKFDMSTVRAATA